MRKKKIWREGGSFRVVIVGIYNILLPWEGPAQVCNVETYNTSVSQYRIYTHRGASSFYSSSTVFFLIPLIVFFCQWNWGGALLLFATLATVYLFCFLFYFILFFSSLSLSTLFESCIVDTGRIRPIVKRENMLGRNFFWVYGSLLFSTSIYY